MIFLATFNTPREPMIGEMLTEILDWAVMSGHGATNGHTSSGRSFLTISMVNPSDDDVYQLEECVTQIGLLKGCCATDHRLRPA
jgi:hypothetical protein